MLKKLKHSIKVQSCCRLLGLYQLNNRLNLEQSLEDLSRCVRLISKQDTEQVRKALRLITADQRQVIVLRFLEGWSSQEIAQTMGKSLGAIKALQHRGVAALQRILIERLPPEGEET